MLCAEPGDRAVIRHVLRAGDPARHIGVAQPLDLPARPLPDRVGVDQHTEKHRRVIPRPARTPEPLSRPKRAQIQTGHRIQHEPHQMINRQPLPHIRRHQKPLIPIHRPKPLSHPTILQNTEDQPPQARRFCNRLWSDSKTKIMTGAS